MKLQVSRMQTLMRRGEPVQTLEAVTGELRRPKIAYRETVTAEASLIRLVRPAMPASTISGLGRDRPVSTKLRCLGDMPTSWARSIWLRRRRWRQPRSRSPTGTVVAVAMAEPYEGVVMAAITSEVIVPLPGRPDDGGTSRPEEDP